VNFIQIVILLLRRYDVAIIYDDILRLRRRISSFHHFRHIHLYFDDITDISTFSLMPDAVTPTGFDADTKYKKYYRHGMFRLLFHRCRCRDTKSAAPYVVMLTPSGHRSSMPMAPHRWQKMTIHVHTRRLRVLPTFTGLHRNKPHGRSHATNVYPGSIYRRRLTRGVRVNSQ